MAYPYDTYYDPYPKVDPLNEPDPEMQHIEIICGYPDTPGVFVSPPFYAGVFGPLQVYLERITKAQDILINLNDVYPSPPHPDVNISYLVGVKPTSYSDEKDSYFPSHCGQEWIADEIESKSFSSLRWSKLPNWTASVYLIGACLVVLKDLDGNYWPQHQNWKDAVQFGALSYIQGTCVDWERMNPSDVTKTLHIRTPHVSGQHAMFDCRRHVYSFYVYMYHEDLLPPPTLLPQLTALTAGIMMMTLFAPVVRPSKRKKEIYA